MIPHCVESNILFKLDEEDKTEIYTLKIDNLKYIKPTDELNKKYVTPHICRNRNLSYNICIFGDIRIVKDTYENNNIQNTQIISECKEFHIVTVPCMVKSKLCNTYNYSTKDDICPGGYFIINGNEKCIVSIERTAWNQIIYSKKEKFIYASTLYSQKDDLSPIHPFTIILDSKSNKIYVNSSIFSVEIPIFVFLFFIQEIEHQKLFEIFESKNKINLQQYIEYNLYYYYNIKQNNEIVDYVFNKLSGYIKNKYSDQNLDIDMKFKVINESIRLKILPHMEQQNKFFKFC